MSVQLSRQMHLHVGSWVYLALCMLLCVFLCVCAGICVLQSVHIWDCARSAVVSVYVFDVYLGSVSSVIHMGVCVWVYSALCMCS